MRWIKRIIYALSGLLLLWMVAVQAGCMSFRTADSAWTAKFVEKGQTLAPQFADIPGPAGRTIHAVYVRTSDTLPVIMCVHGSPGSADAYLDFLADTALSRRAQLISIDRPGFGYTSGFGVPEPSLDVQADAVLAVLDSLAPGKPALLMGHSLGAPVVVDFAGRYPERCTGLMLLGGSVDPDLEPDPWWQSTVHNPPVKWIIPKSMWTSNAEIIPLRGELERIKPIWANITCPIVMVHAYDDSLVPFGNVAYAQRMAAHTARFSTVVFEKGDHFVIWTQHDTVRRALEEMMR